MVLKSHADKKSKHHSKIKLSGKSNSRPDGYQYFNILKDYLNGDLTKIFNEQLVYPRQLEIHLPANHKKPCNFDCFYCQGRLLEQPLIPFETKALKILDELKGIIPYMIYGGAYSEPLLNPWLPDFLKLTKKHSSYFGIHTNGSLLKRLEKEENFLSELCSISSSSEDYLSISLDAGSIESHMKTKNLKKNYFDGIIKGIEEAVNIRGESKFPSLRVCYLLNRFNSSEKEIKGTIDLMKKIGVDSLRFSIPYDLYGKNFDRVRSYKNNVELKQKIGYEKILQPLMSKDHKEKPFIFYIPPECQDVDKMNFKQCIYSYYQITLGADGYVYKCSSTATPTFKMNRLGKILDNLAEFNKMILKNHNPKFNPSTCFEVGARCNRMALEINLKWYEMNKKNGQD